MPLHPTLQAMLDNFRASGRSGSLRDGTVEEARAAYALITGVGGDPPELAPDLDRTIPGPAGEIPVRVYRPHGDGPFPVLVYFHGGGFTIGSIESHDPVCRQLAARSGAAVVSVEYRLAPEHRFPAAVDDAFAATAWIAANAESFRGDGSRLAVSGDSAGGNLATVTSLLARDRGGPAICFQALVYPGTDPRGGYPSLTENADGLFLTADTLEWFGEQYASRDEDRDDWRWRVIAAPDLSGLPPALVITAEYDPLRDEGEAYAEALRRAGNDVTVHRYDGMAHVFFQMAGILDEAREALAEVAGAVSRAFATAGAGRR